MRLALLVLLSSVALAQVPSVSFGGENMRLASASVSSAGANAWTLTLQMDDDNGNGSLSNSWRRWWHCEIDNLTPGDTLNFRVTNAGYTDIILPTWAQSSDGVTFGDYARMPTSSTPTLVGGSQHQFSVTVPAGVVAIRMAKYFPYTVTEKDAMVAAYVGHPRVRAITTLGLSQQGRAIEMLELTDSSVPDAGKERVWIHSGIHPAETTSYFMIEGLLAWLTSGETEAEALLDNAILNVVPMANPDGVFLGNYRTNANSVNLESDWSAPYNSPQPELVALRTAIEGYMGTVANPGSNPIRILLNLHSSHNITLPFHFQHVANSNWSPGCTSCGVIPIVNQVEGEWIADFKARSPFVDIGPTLTSTLGSRPFVESMCHDRWTAVNGWLNAPNFEDPVMAITFEGTYGAGPDGVTWNTDDDYRQVGEEMGQALFDNLDLSLSATATPYGSSCGAVQLLASVVPQPNGSHIANLLVLSGPGPGVAVIVLGGAQVQVPFPAPWSGCDLLATPDVTALLALNLGGSGVLPVTVPATSGLTAYVQAVTFDAVLQLDSSNGLILQNNF